MEQRTDRRGDAADPSPRGAGPPGGAQRLVGTCERVTYHSAETLYTVLKVKPVRGYGDPEAPPTELFPRLTAVGRTPLPAEGARVEMSGRWETHPTHGRRFAFATLRVLPPLDEEGLVRYFASKSFPGIGETLARRIVEALGTRALSVIEEEPERLAEVRGLRRSVAEALVERVHEERAGNRTLAYLLGLGLGPWQAEQVARAYGHRTEALLEEDPYRLATGVEGIGFRTADRVAQAMGFAPDSLERRRAAVFQAATDASDDGHVRQRPAALFERCRRLLADDSSDASLREALDDLVANEEVVCEVDGAAEGEEPEEWVYLPRLRYCEETLAENLAAHLATPLAPLATEEELAHAERRAGLTLHPLQREAVLGMLARPVALLTGGPGVGKTTIVRLVVELAEAAGASVRLASPTGRAAKRLAEATGREASTIHRLLGWDPGRHRFAHDAEDPLLADLLVVDELSMLDLVLAHHLVKAVRPPTRLLLVGDPDQLPSVGAGNVLADLLDCGRLPTWRLTRIYRQAGESLIVANAHRILRGEEPELPDREAPSADFYFFPAEDEERAAERLVEVVTERIPSRFGLRWDTDVQVLAPMYRGECGVDALNTRLRAALGAGGREVEHRGRVWRVGDRVIHVRNDYDKQVFNGDMGRVLEVHADASLLVRYPEQDVVYAPKELSDLQPAFAITVHRSQGGEFPAVVMPLVMRHALMLRRHLLYTAVTRARKLCVLVGSLRALRMAVENAQESRRESGLADRLRELAP